MTKYKLLLIAIIIIFAGFGIKLLLPTKIVDVHSLEGYKKRYYIIVKNFPITDRGKKNWWYNNKNTLAKKYEIPVDKEDFDITFWVSEYQDGSIQNRGNGYLICFDDMKVKANCIDKENRPLQISYNYHQRETMFHYNQENILHVENNQTGESYKLKF
ncbi:DUF943 family protein [Erwiniaceae bacterium BAC15a-03b]|uniref:DUF943 family protein n=1 Tax=Winslowiella arboricola TaxID=2978220 RepID=A0A9J6PJC1_9GAMM|nr:DUF943 family protein [Winslowiella arboricola]MCU5771836.1 DUF943 family protein [Winslowiella arboricola]MCU5777466.1 DUF943 family protein [Winslowiella arboricola]